MLTPLRTRWTGTWIGGLALIAVCVCFHLPGLFTLPPIDRDESRFAEASRRMVVAEHWRDRIVPTIQGHPRLNKPPLIYWLQASCAALLLEDSQLGRPDRATSDASPAAEPAPRRVPPKPPAVRGSRSLSRAGPLRRPTTFPVFHRCETRSRRGAAEELARAPGDSGTGPAPDGGLITGGIWAYRLPSVLGVLVAVLATWRLGLGMFARPCGWLAGLLLGSCVVVVFDARQARADEVLLACTTVAHLALWHLWRSGGRRGGWALVFWLAVGLGVMTKGPVTPAMAALTCLALGAVTGDWAWLKRLRPLLGLAILGALVVPWLVLVADQVGWSRLGRTLTDEILVRSVAGKEGHGAPPGYHLLLLPVLFWPASLALVPAVHRAFRRALRFPNAEPPGPDAVSRGRLGFVQRWRVRWRHRRPRRSAELFCLAWLLPGWLVFELVATKLPHYPLPLYPALALLCARSLYAVRGSWLPLLARRSVVLALWGWLLLGEVLAVGTPILLVSVGRLRSDPTLLVLVGAGIVLAQVFLVLLLLAVRARRVLTAQTISLAVALVTHANVLHLLLPNLDALWLSSRIAARIHQVDPAGNRPVAAVGYDEDSLIFLTQGRAERLTAPELHTWRERHPRALMVIADRTRPFDWPARKLATIEGFNYSGGGRWQRLDLVENAE